MLKPATAPAEKKTIVVTDTDLERLRALIREGREVRSEGHVYLQALEAELERAELVPSREIPPDVVTMNSRVRIRSDEQKRGVVFTVVYPRDADLDENRISVLAPIGTALLGYRVGDAVEWDVPAGRRRFHIEEVVYQPEAAGHYHL